MSQKLNILFLCSWYPSREHRTLGNFVQRHALAVSKLHHVTVLYGVESTHAETQVDSFENVEEHRVYFKKQFPLWSYKKAMTAAYNQLNDKKQFDLVHIHVTYPAAILVNTFNQPYIVTEHFSGFHKNTGFKWGYLRKQITRKALNKASFILPVSNHLGEAIVKFGVKNSFQKVSNVVDTDTFYLQKPKASPFTFLHVSSLEERSKNISGILQSFKALDQNGIEFLLEIGGDGDIEALDRQIEELGISKHKVTTFGEASSQEIANKMRQCHCLVMFSHFENQPCTILEALCCGKPIVSSNVGGIPEEIDESNGILVDKGDSSSFTKSLQKVIENYSTFNSEEISENATNSYGHTAVANSISKIYFSVLNKDS